MKHKKTQSYNILLWENALDSSDMSDIFASFTRIIAVIWSYRHYMSDTPNLYMYAIVNKHV